MDDTGFIREFISVERSQGDVVIRVCQIEWPAPHSPVSKWTTAKRLGANASEEEIDLAVQGLLEDGRYFRVCVECDEPNPTGHMHDDRICQSCAERNHGVVY